MQGCTGTIVPTRGGRKQISEGPFMSKLASISAVLGIAMPSAMISSPSLAEQMKSKADMSASQVVPPKDNRSEEHTSELQSLMRISYAVFCLNNKQKNIKQHTIQYLTCSIKQ